MNAAETGRTRRSSPAIHHRALDGGAALSKWRAGWRKKRPKPPARCVVDLADVDERDMRLLARWRWVHEGLGFGLSWTDAYRYAAEVLLYTEAGAVTERTMKEAHVRATARWGDPSRVAWERLPPIFESKFEPDPAHVVNATEAAYKRVQGPGKGKDRARRAASKRARAAREIAIAMRERLRHAAAIRERLRRAD